MSLVMPSVRSRVMARPDAAQGNLATLISRLSFCAWVSVRPHQAISGSVKTTAGIAAGSNATLCPAMASTAVRAFVRGLVGQHGFADHVADGVDRRIVGLQLLVHLNESACAHFNCVLSRPGNFRIRFAPHRYQNFVENLLAFLDLRRHRRSHGCRCFFFHGGHSGVQQNGIKIFFDPLVQAEEPGHGRRRAAVRIAFRPR